jgi:Zinc carboxypeptidase/Immune inhibitor A peptidase M6
MRRVSAVLISVLALVAGMLGAVGAASAAPTSTPGGAGPDVYAGVVERSQIDDIVDLGVDRHELLLSPVRGQDAAKGSVRVEVILTEEQADELREGGVDLEPKTVDGMTATERATLQAAEGYEVFRTYSGDGGLREEFEQAAADNPRVTKLVTIGHSVNGTDIVALKVSRNARVQPDGQKPATVYVGAQHAREWITPEMIRRLMHLVLDGYGNDAQITDLVNTTELWFIPVANPDGYDWTFEPGQRLWRKNLRDNNGDGVITGGDGVDPNRNFATKWGYDNEGSSPLPGSEVFRGTAPGSEPETQALDSLMNRLRPEFLVNYHSAAELLLYGVGWQVATPSPDDVIYEALAGDDENPAIEGYDPDISAELYTTNGETTEHMQSAYGVLGFTPEMSTCQTVSAQDPDDEWDPLACASVFNFPDDEELVQKEFEKNIPFALSVAESAKDPGDPVSVVGRTAEDFRLDTFDVSYGDPQTVAVVAKRELRNLRLRYRVAGGSERSVAVQEWQGGERYGGSNDRYYAEFRGQVTGARPGQQVQVWFTGVKPGTGPVASDRFTYRLAQDTGDRVLVVANEDYEGVNPDYPESVTAPQYLDAHVQAVEDAGFTADTWDVDAQGVPHDLGVLGHYDGVLWYLGDNRITQDPEDVLTSTPFGQLPDISVAERQQYLTMAVRDYLNAGGKLVHSGETAQFEGLPGISTVVGGLYYGLNGAPEEPCVISPRPGGSTAGFFEDCLILADDFRQYWLGGFTRTGTSGPDGVAGVAEPIDGFVGAFGGPVAEGTNPLNEAGVFIPTSDVLPPGQFPQFASQGAAEYASADGTSPYAPIEGERYAGALHADSSYMRLTRTVNVPAAPATTHLRFQLSYSVETGYDHVIVEARTPGQQNWTTLPDLEGGTSTAPPAECAAGFLLDLHPFLANYLGGADCTGPGATGTWNSFTGSSNGWTEAGVDLSAYAGQQVEVSISYVTDPFVSDVGVFVDDTRVVVDGAVVEQDGFEGATSAWTVGGPPAGSPPNGQNWQIAGQLVTVYAGTSTEDTLLLGFGLEHLATEDERADLVERALSGLLD